MATTHWRTGYSVNQLFTEPDANWSFHQLTRLLMGMNTGDEDWLEVLNDTIHFTSFHAQVLPAGEIRRVRLANPAAGKGPSTTSGHSLAKRQANPQAKHQVECTYYNLTGLDGPLADPFVDLLRQDLRYGKGALAAFIDIFNNRLQALRYLIHAENNTSLTTSLAEHTRVGKFMLALSGHDDVLARQRHHQDEASLISLAGSLANCRMSLPLIRKLFAIVLGIPLIALNCLLGRWLKVQDEDHTLLGQSNHRLSTEATLGTRIWDQQAAVELVLGPLALDRIQRLVPGGEDHQALRDLVSWISDKDCDFQITLMCLKDSIEPKTTRLSTDNLSAGDLSTGDLSTGDLSTGDLSTDDLSTDNLSTGDLSTNKNDNNRLGYGATLQGTSGVDKQVRFQLKMV
ncbi:type VI secretion system baseplate subunit TssG [Marinomonas aquiplantarum]|uniref:Type VI secretion system ImpH/TssG family protein n=1 Tax=Marinomonas aquiplantarum TaxID=491951 RepID=A0A366CY35_9GAMM|nr:type VI secretion system baseplate subunit TssG [Marinomonas aquiplantarum]RBO81898.1 type VI secretion system ImpH/TssG family protein [Marinomonas aquiplantarum]